MAENDWNCTFFFGIIDKFADIPAIGVDDFVLAGGLHKEYLAFGASTMYFATCLAGVDVAAVVVAELHDNVVAGFESLVYLVPTTFVEECTGATASHCMVFNSYFGAVELLGNHAAPTPLAVAVVFVLDGAVADSEYNRATGLTAAAGGIVYRFGEKVVGKSHAFECAETCNCRFGIVACTEL